MYKPKRSITTVEFMHRVAIAALGAKTGLKRTLSEQQSGFVNN